MTISVATSNLTQIPRGRRALTRPGQAVNFRLFERVQIQAEDVVEGRAVASLRRWFRMARVFLTGGTGFVGRRLADMLVEQGHAITAIARATSDTGHLESLGVSIVRGELYDADFLAEAMAGCGQLHHVASLVDNDWARPEDYYRSNVTATRAVFQAAKRVGIERAVYTSSITAFGIHPKGAVVDERTQPRYGFLHPYGHSKYLGELEALSLVKSGMRVTTINPASHLWAGRPQLKPARQAFYPGRGAGPCRPRVEGPNRPRGRCRQGADSRDGTREAGRTLPDLRGDASV